jgi:hypothetical protein
MNEEGAGSGDALGIRWKEAQTRFGIADLREGEAEQ